MKTTKQRKIAQLAAVTKWRVANRQKARDATQRWYLANRETADECQRKYREANPGKVRAWSKGWRKRNPDYSYKKYGMTTGEFQAMSDEQSGACVICRAVKKLCVDHCHETGKIRGLLCRSCNVSLGLMKDSFSNLIRAADYIRRRAIVSGR